MTHTDSTRSVFCHGSRHHTESKSSGHPVTAAFASIGETMTGLKRDCSKSKVDAANVSVSGSNTNNRNEEHSYLKLERRSEAQQWFLLLPMVNQ